nr:hypothetical protein Iba_chr14bCG9990 [Ipomoea batatas]
MPGTTRPGSRSRHLTYFTSVDGSALGSATPSAVGPTPRTAIASAVGPAAAAASTDGPAETPTTGTGRVRPSRTFENGVEPGSGTSSGRTARTLGRSSSWIETSRAGFVERFAEKSKLLAATVVELVQMVKDALEHMYDDINFKANPDNIAAVEEIENAIVMKQGLMDRPSFSLGLTQTLVVSPGGGVQDIVAGCTVVRNGGCPFSLVDGVIQDEATVDLLQLGDIEISGNVVPTVAVDGNNTADLITPPPQIFRCCTKSLSDTIAIAQLKTPLKVAQPHSKASLKVGDDAWDMPSFSLGLTQSPVVLPTENVQKSGMDCTVARSTECPSSLKVGAVQFAAMVNPPLLGKIEVYAHLR